jgi:hypothetical protein
LTDPFKITGHTVVANSGGKTSGYSLWRHLKANDGTLTERGRCVFNNTGWEHELTLDFLAEQEQRWGQKIIWLEFCRRPATPEELAKLKGKADTAAARVDSFRGKPASSFGKTQGKARVGSLFNNSPGPRQLKKETLRKARKHAANCLHSWKKAELIGIDTFRRVTRNTASTDGRPYQELLEGLLKYRNEVRKLPGVLPNGVQRICTGHLKVKTTTKFAFAEWGVARGDFECRLGLRSDEEERLKNAQSWDNEGGRAVFPLDTAGIVKADVAKFWAEQGWGITLKAHEGNCGLCYMKRRNALVDLIRRDFADLGWWEDWESRTQQRFRNERSYRGLRVAARTELDLLPPDDLDNGITCEGGYCSN